MEFYTVCSEKRPVRLCDVTRRFAYDSLNHKYGLDTKRTPCIVLDNEDGFENMKPVDRYDIAIRKIAEEAPVRICENELISGAATLGNAIGHVVPAVYKGENIQYSVSHLTVDFRTVLKCGINGIKAKAAESAIHQTEQSKIRFLQSCFSCIDSFELWHRRYLEELMRKPDYENNYKNLLKVPMQPAESFYEAVQSLWFTFAFIRLCGNWPGIGRLDYLLGEYLKNDLAAGALTLSEAREILAHFFIKGCEWICGGECGSGDAQHYQNIVLAGVDENGEEITNEVTYLVLDIIEELGIGDFPTTVRVGKNTPPELLTRVAEVIRHGGGVIAIYNEDLIIQSMTDFGYSLREARSFANDGCWEVQVPGKTYFLYAPFDSLRILQQFTLKDYGEELDYGSFEELYRRYISDLKVQIEAIYNSRLGCFEPEGTAKNEWRWNPAVPCTVVSLFEEGCIEKGLSYMEGGPVYNIFSPHIGGIADTANSLYAIKKLVYDEKKLSLNEFMSILKNNWSDNEPLRQYILTNYSYFGNDEDEVDLLTARILSDFSDLCAALNGRCPYQFPSGVSTFGRQEEWSRIRLASPHGHKAGEVLAANCSPTPGTDKEGATAIIKSYCKIDLKKQVTGAALDIRLTPECVGGSEGISAIAGLILGFVRLGGFFMQPDIIDAEILKEAQKNPEKYQTLSVRVSGWNARFVTLNKEWQDMVIAQAGNGAL